MHRTGTNGKQYGEAELVDKKVPATGLAYRNAGEFRRHADHSDFDAGCNSLYELGCKFAARCVAAERLFLAATWLDPVGGNNAAVDAGLTGQDLVDPFHSFVFCYCCRCAEGERLPDVAEAYALAETVGLPMPSRKHWATDYPSYRSDPFDLIFEIINAIFYEPDQVKQGSVGELAEIVKQLSRKRRRARTALRIIGEVFSDETLEVVVRPRSPKGRLRFRGVA